MRKLLSLALACNLTVVGATSVVACGAADGPAVGLEVNDQDPGTKATYITNDAYKGHSTEKINLVMIIHIPINLWLTKLGR